jgi:hypothetical protein
MSKVQQIKEPLFQGIDLAKLHDVETVTDEKAEKFVFEDMHRGRFSDFKSK